MPSTSERVDRLEEVFARRTHPADRGQMIELDLLVAGKEHLMVVEAKRRLTSEKIREFVDKVSTIPVFFPEYEISGWCLSLPASRSILPWSRF